MVAWKPSYVSPRGLGAHGLAVHALEQRISLRKAIGSGLHSHKGGRQARVPEALKSVQGKVKQRPAAHKPSEPALNTQILFTHKLRLAFRVLGLEHAVESRLIAIDPTSRKAWHLSRHSAHYVIAYITFVL